MTTAKTTAKTRAPAGRAASFAGTSVTKGVAPRPVDTRMVRLSDPEMKPAMDRLKARIASDPAFAQSLLHSAGIVTAKGKLTKRFGG